MFKYSNFYKEEDKMKRTFKKILCTLLVVVMCLTSAPLSGFVGLELPEFSVSEWFASKASAASEGYYTYTITDGEATITDVNPSVSGDITIPATLGGYSVTTIGDYAFYDCDSLTDVYYMGTEEQWNDISIGLYNDDLLNICGKECSCNCHKSGFMNFIWKIVQFFWKLFNIFCTPALSCSFTCSFNKKV